MLFERIEREQMAIRWKQIMPSLLKAIRAKAKLGEVMDAVENEPDYKEIYEKWEGLTLDEMMDAWEKVTVLMSKMAYATRPYCVRCGDCCSKSSPILYVEDMDLFSRGILEKHNVFTLRRGETGYSPKESSTVILTEEMIKIKEDEENEGQCVFYKDKECSIYADRPLQCRTLECWNPDGFGALSSHKPLDRKTILTEDHPLWEIIAAHEKRCSHEVLREILKGSERLEPDEEDKAMDIVFYDIHVRMFLEEKTGVKQDDMNFFFGCPVIRTLSACGYQLEAEEGQPTHIIKTKD